MRNEKTVATSDSSAKSSAMSGPPILPRSTCGRSVKHAHEYSYNGPQTHEYSYHVLLGELINN